MREPVYFVRLARDNYFKELEVTKRKDDILITFIAKLNDSLEIVLSNEDAVDLVIALNGVIND